MNRHDFMNWAEVLLARKLGVPRVTRQGDNNVQATFEADVHIGIVATEKAAWEVRVHIWSREPTRRARWRAGATIPPPYPPNTTLKSRSGSRSLDYQYLEFAWPNPDLQRFQVWQAPVEACVDFFVRARRIGVIP